MLLPGEWLKIDFEGLKLPPSFADPKGRQFLSNLNSEVKYPIRPSFEQTNVATKAGATSTSSSTTTAMISPADR